MLNLIENISPVLVAFLGILFSFFVTFLCTAKLNKYLPSDQGRKFAHDGALSQGKPRGAGIIFVLVFAISALVFGQLSVELGIYLALIIVEMLTGFFDDAAEKPWGEYLKGALDLVVAVITAVVYLYYNGSTIKLAIVGAEWTIPPVVYGILTVILVWVAINVTNCADGVDGLSSSLVLVTLGTFYIINQITGLTSFSYPLLLFMAGLLAYLWYNATPSKLLMGDAGSRAMGFLIALASLKSGDPFLFVLVALVILVDGGLGLVKVSLLRFLKIHILKNTTTPIHDHVRKNKGWSNTHVVFRFAIIQIIISLVTVYLILL